MASSAKMFAEVVIAGSYKGLARSTRGASKEMNSLAGKTKATAKIMSSAIAGISFVAITQQLVAATKAADEDRRSMALLNRTLDVSWKATDATKQSVDDFITSMSLMSGIADDDLRPSYARLAQQTKSITKANKYFQLAMDISADKGVALDVATKAVSKALAGSESAFNKLYPAAKNSADAIEYVTKKSKGAAKLAGDNSPFAKMNVTFGELQETIGRQLLPYVDKLAKWMESKEGQKTIKETTKALVDLLKEAIKLGKWALDNKEVIIGIAVALKGWQIGSGIITSWKTLAGIWKGMKAPKVSVPGSSAPGAVTQYAKPIGPVKPVTTPGVAAGAFSGLSAGLSGLAVVSAMKAQSYGGPGAKDAILGDIKRAKDEYGKYYSPTELLLATGKKNTGGISSGGSNMSNVTININGVVSGNDVVKALKNVANTRGIPLRQLLG